MRTRDLCDTELEHDGLKRGERLGIGLPQVIGSCPWLTSCLVALSIAEI